MLYYEGDYPHQGPRIENNVEAVVNKDILRVKVKEN